MARLTDLTTLDIHYAHTDVDEAALHATDVHQASELRTLAAASRTHTSVQAFTKLTHLVDGQRRIIEQPPLIVRLDEGSAFGDQVVDVYGQYCA